MIRILLTPFSGTVDARKLPKMVENVRMKMLTPAEAAARLRISRRTIIGWLQTGRLSGIKVGKQWRVPEDRLADIGTEPLDDNDALTWHDADIGGDLPPYDFGPRGVPEMRPVKWRKGKGLVIVDSDG